MGSWSSYSKIYALGHREAKALLDVPCIIEEKVDGSQFSFSISEEDGGILVRSKGAVMFWEAPEKMFSKAVDTAVSLRDVLHPGWTYRGEYLRNPKHNALVYDRVPKDHIILFDIATDSETYLPYKQKAEEAARIGLEVVPKLFEGIPTLELVRQLLDTESVLGGQKIEGVVIKPRDYNLFGQDKKVIMGKFVSEAFKEVHSKVWGEANPSKTDMIEAIASDFRTPARWHKAIMHMRERGELTGSPKDIGPLMKEVVADIESEDINTVKDRLFKFAWPHIRRKLTAGLPEFYKELLLKQHFEQEAA